MKALWIEMRKGKCAHICPQLCPVRLLYVLCWVSFRWWGLILIVWVYALLFLTNSKIRISDQVSTLLMATWRAGSFLLYWVQMVLLLWTSLRKLVVVAIHSPSGKFKVILHFHSEQGPKCVFNWGLITSCVIYFISSEVIGRQY